MANEPASLLFWPMTVISLPAFTLLYPILLQQSHPLARAAAFYFAFIVSLVLYGSYLWWGVPYGTAMMIPLVLLAGHWYGLPFLAIIWFANMLLSPFLLREPGITQ
jgi:hypothetical protein